MKRPLLSRDRRGTAVTVVGMGLVAGTYGLVRLAYGLFLPDIQASLELGDAAAGYVAAGASAAYCVGAFCGLVAAHRPRSLVLGALLTASVGAVGIALAPGLGVLVPAAVLSSTGAGLASPGLIGLVERNVAPALQGRAQAVVNAGTGPGLVGAGALALVLLPDWRLGLLLGGVLTAAAGVGVLALDRAAGTPGPPRPGGRPSVPALRVPAVAAVLLGAASAAVWTYGRTLLVDQGASASASVVAWIGLGVGGTATVLTAGRLARRRPARAWLLSTVVVAAATATLGLAGGLLWVAVLACVAFGWGFVAASSALIAWTGRLSPGSAAAGTSLLFVMLVVGQAVGAAAAGVMADRHGLPTTFVLAAAVAALAATCGAGRLRPVRG